MPWHLLTLCKQQLKEVCAVCFLVITDGKRTGGMNKLRQNQNTEYKAVKADLELGLGGVQKALEGLCEYYGGASAMIQKISSHMDGMCRSLKSDGSLFMFRFGYFVDVLPVSVAVMRFCLYILFYFSGHTLVFACVCVSMKGFVSQFWYSMFEVLL